MKHVAYIIAFGLAALIASAPGVARAQQAAAPAQEQAQEQAQEIIPATPSTQDALRRQLEHGRIGIVTGGPGGTYIRLGSDLSRLLAKVKGDDLRVIVMEGKGSGGNLRDLAFLKYTDLALVQADVLEHIRNAEPAGYAFLRSQIVYVARFHPEIVHILARGGPFNGPQELAGKKIAIGLEGSGTRITAPILFGEKYLNIDAEFVAMGQEAALADLLSPSPTIDAMVYVAGRGASVFNDIPEPLREGITNNAVFFVPLPESPPDESPYVGETLQAADYPRLIADGFTVDAWAVPAVLAAYNWKRIAGRNAAAGDRHRRLVDFVNVFFDNRKMLDDGPGGYNDNWCSIDLGAEVGGWLRSDAAQQWLTDHPGEQTKICAGEMDELAESTESNAPTPENCPAFEEVGIPLDDPAIETVFSAWLRNNPGRC